MRINLNLLKAVAVAVGNEATRYYLNGVFVQPKHDGIYFVATDGHRMIVARQKRDDSEAPETKNGVIVPSSLINRIKPNKQLPYAGLSFEGNNAIITDFYTGDKLTSPVIDGTYPDWQRVVPTEINNEIGQFNPAYIADFAKAMKQAGIGGKIVVPSIHHNGNSASLVNMGKGEDFNWFGVLMPTRTDYDKLPDISWVNPKTSQAIAA